MKTRITAFALALLMLLSTVSCGESQDQSKETSENNTQDSMVEEVPSEEITSATESVLEETSPFVADSLPEINLMGESIRFSVMSNQVEQYTSPEITGEGVNDAIYQANETVMDRLNAKIEYIEFSYPSYSERQVYLDQVAQSILSQEDSYDVLVSMAFMANFFQNGYLMNLADKPYLDLTKPWWSQDMVEQIQFNGVLPMITGDISIAKTKAMMCMFFNQDICTNYDLENLYSLVDEGKWTVDKFHEMTSKVNSDLNGNTTVDENDRLGMVLEGSDYYLGFLDSCDMEILEKQEDTMTFVYNNEHNVNVVQKLVSILHDTEGIIQFGNGDTAHYLADNNIFRNGNVLFTGGWVGCSESYRDVDFTYGIVPYPKYDETQDKYGCTVLHIYSNYALPITNTRVESTCAVLEALGSEFYRTVTPSYFETALKSKYSSSDDMSRMFDLLRENSGFNIGLTFTSVLNYIAEELKLSLISGDTNWSSKMASKKKLTEKGIEKLLDVYEEMASK